MTPDHLIAAPILLPLIAGAVLLVVERFRPAWQGAMGAGATLALAATALALVRRAAGDEVGVYLVGNWPSPFGIALALDRLSALMVALTAGVGLAALTYALDRRAVRGPHFHAFFQFQLAGLNGAFLTADLFNLFVFFEVLLIASYALLLHAADGRTLRAGFHYVVVNLAGSSLFLIAASLMYGVCGTLGMAELAVRIAAAPAADAALLQAAGLMLLVVFAVKAALLPLGFWLPDTYGAAPAPVAALFALMTKVGVYAIVRVATLLFGPDAGPLAALGATELFVLGVATTALGALGALAAPRLKGIVAFLVVASAGTLVAASASGALQALAGALYYLVHSTLAVAFLFLLVDVIARQRGQGDDRLYSAPPIAQPVALGLAFLAASVAIAGLPPLSGFIGKLGILDGTIDVPLAPWLWTALLASGLLVTIALARAGSRIFWKTQRQGANGAAVENAVRVGGREALAIGLLGGALVALTVLAGPAQDYAVATAVQLADPRAYIERVRAAPPVTRRAAVATVQEAGR
jgi:multicomponent K+:H+ antiporter subunit D